MVRSLKKHSKKSGLPPGTLMHIGERKADQVTLEYIDYDSDFFDEKSQISIKDIIRIKDSSTVSWINIVGLHDISIFEELNFSNDTPLGIITDFFFCHTNFSIFCDFEIIFFTKGCIR